MKSFILPVVRCGLAGAVLATAGCGGSGSPTAPTPPPRTPSIAVTVSPSPLQATFKSSDGTTATYEIRADVTYREIMGVAARVTGITATILRNPGAPSVSNYSVNLPIAAGGTTTDTYTHAFNVTTGVDSVTWQFSATFADSEGRSYETTPVNVTIAPPAQPPPPPPPPAFAGAGQLVVLGGLNHDVFLGCFTCNEFDSQSVHNQFGPYGSKFSNTSIKNHFSPYGSKFSSESACNQFASSPPWLYDAGTHRFSELTLNRYRPNATRDQSILTWLQVVVCEQ